MADFSLADIVTTLRNLVVSLNNLSKNVSASFPQTTGTSSSATAGAATLPANPVGFITVTLPNGTTAKVPYYT